MGITISGLEIKTYNLEHKPKYFHKEKKNSPGKFQADRIQVVFYLHL